MTNKTLKILPLTFSILSLITGSVFMSLFLRRYNLPYNEMGRYLEEVSVVVYDSDSLPVYGFLTIVFYFISLVLLIKTMKK